MSIQTVYDDLITRNEPSELIKPDGQSISLPNSTVTFKSPNGDIAITSIQVVDGSTFKAIDSDGNEHTIEVFGVKARGLDETYGKWQAAVLEDVFFKAAKRGDNIFINTTFNDKDKSTAEIKIVDKDQTFLDTLSVNVPYLDLSQTLAANGVLFPKNYNTSQAITQKSNDASLQSDPKGLYKEEHIIKIKAQDLDKKTEKVLNDLKVMSYVNKRYGQSKSLRSDTSLRIGDVEIDIPPTGINISQMRNSTSIEMLGNESMTIPTLTNRVVIKVSTIFSGSYDIANSLKRILLQFKFCPVNLIRSKDLFEKLAGNLSYLEAHYKDEYFIPVTMDSYTLWTIENHPNSIAVTFQFSLFNYTAYFSGDKTERVEYRKVDMLSNLPYVQNRTDAILRMHDKLKSVVQDKEAATTYDPLESKIEPTCFLEQALHPYNLYVERIIEDEKDQWVDGDSRVDILKVSRVSNFARSVPEEDKDEEGTIIDANENPLDLNRVLSIEESVTSLLATKVVIFYENQFAWQPIIGYSQPAAQYIGPGETSINITAYTDDNEVIKRLQKTYNEAYEQGKEYDDRYLILTPLTSLTKNALGSMQHCNIQNVNGSPGTFEINLSFLKNIYATNAFDENPAGAFDDYWGLQRFLKILDNSTVRELTQKKLDFLSTRVSGFPDGKNVLEERPIEVANGINLKELDGSVRAAMNRILAEVGSYEIDLDDPKWKSASFYLKNPYRRTEPGSNWPSDELSNKKIEIIGQDILDRIKIVNIPTLDDTVEYEIMSKVIKITDLWETLPDAEKKLVSREKLWDFEFLLTSTTLLGYTLRKILIEEVLFLASDTISEYEYDWRFSSNPFKAKYGEAGTWSDLNNFSYSTQVSSSGVGASYTYNSTKINYSKAIGAAIKDALIKRQLFKQWVLNWNAEKYASFNRNEVRFQFSGKAYEAKFLFYMFCAYKNKKIQEAFFIPKSGEGPWPQFFVALSDETSQYMTSDVSWSEKEIDDTVNNKKWIFTLIYVPHDGADIKGWIEEPSQEEIQKLYDKFKQEQIEAAEANEGKEKIFAKPYAAHRYYPGIQWFLNQSPFDSASVGDWFLHRKYENFNNELKDVADATETAISPFANTEAWNSVYMQTHAQYGDGFTKLLFDDDDPHNPLEVMKAVVFPTAKKDYNRLDEKTGKIDTRIGILVGREESDVPMSSLDHQLYAKGFYGLSKRLKEHAEKYQNFELEQKECELTKGRRYDISQLYDTSTAFLGRTTKGKTLYTASGIPIHSLAPDILSDPMVGAPKLETSIKLDTKLAAYENNFTIFGGLKNPANISTLPAAESILSKKKDSILKSEGTLSEDKFYAIFVYGLIRAKEAKQRLEIAKGLDPLYTFTDDSQKIQHAKANTNIVITEEANKIKNHFIKVLGVDIVKEVCTSEDVVLYKAYNDTIAIDAILSRIVGTSDINTIDDDTRSLMVKQFMASSQMTSGIENAFPTYKMYIIESDTSDIKYYSLDDYYDFRYVQDIMVIRDRDNPAHILKARVVIDPRYVTVSKDSTVINEIEKTPLHPKDGEQRNPSTTFIDTEKEQTYNKEADMANATAVPVSKIPIIEGMRICLKLGYHSDPRMMDTVFIGTLESLSPTGQAGSYELLARGDGRELLAPSYDEKENITGTTFAEIISKLLRANPSVVHFGKVYGSFLEKFSRKHYAVLALIKGSMKTVGILGAGFAVAQPYGLVMRKASKRIGLSILKRAAGSATAYTTIAALTSYSGLWTDIVTMGRGIEDSLHNYFAETDGKWRFLSTKFNELKTYMKGSIFDLEKAGEQVGRILFETQQKNNDPIDDNIFAVNIWSNWGSLWNSDFNMSVNNKKSLWNVLQTIKRCYPNFALDVRPYGSRSTLFLGPREFNYWRTDDPLIAMAPQLHEISNSAINANEAIISSSGRNVLDGFIVKDKFGGMLANESKGGVAPFVPFQKHHLVTSMGEIISNGIRCTKDRGWNHVIVAYGKDAHSDKDPNVINLLANQGIESGQKITKYDVLDWTNDKQMAKQYAIGLLKEGVERLYGGTLVIRGNERIEPHDRIYICDKINNMHGFIQVDTVIHKFDRVMGFTTHIVPNMVCAVNGDAYTTMGHVLRRKIFNSLKSLTPGSIAIAGVSLAAGSFIGGALAAIGGPFTLVILGASLLMSLASTAASLQRTMKAVDQYTQNANVKDDFAWVPDILNTATVTVANDIFVAGYAVGLITKGVRALWSARSRQNIVEGVKRIGELTKNQFIQMRSTLMSRFKLHNEYAYIKTLRSLVGSNLSVKEILNQDVQDLKIWVAKAEEELERKFSNKALRELKQTTGNKSITELTTAITELEEEVVKRNTVIKKVGTKTKRVLKGGIKAGVIYGLMALLEALPHLFEAFVAEHIADCNVITIHPLIYKNAFMMNGLQGYRNQNAFMHLKDMVLNAKTVLGNTGKFVSEYLPFDSIVGGEKEDISDAKFNDISRSSGQSKSLAQTLSNMSSEDKKETIKKEIDAAIDEFSTMYVIPPELIRAMIQQESSFNPHAVSDKGAYGLMQVLPGTFEDMFEQMGVQGNKYSIRDNIHAGTRYINGLLSKYEKNLSSALAAYNAGPGHVDDYLKGTNVYHKNPELKITPNGIPNFKETQDYVRKVLAYYEKNRKQSEGEL